MLKSLLLQNIIVCATVSLNLLSHSVLSQDPLLPRASPLEVVNLKYEDTYIKITYSRPHKNGRKIFGELVPFGKIWHTGDNESTEIILTNNILVNNDTLKAGAYSIYTIPESEKWTVIFNKEVGQWGTYRYKEKLDVMRFEIPIEKTDVIYEPFTIEFENRGLKENHLNLIWEQTKISIPIEFID